MTIIPILAKFALSFRPYIFNRNDLQMNTLLIIGAVQALFLSLLILTKKKKVLPDYWLTSFLILLFAVFSVVYLSLEPGNEELRLFLIDISLLLMPFFFIYISSLIDDKHRFKKVYLLHFIPYILSSLYYDQLSQNIGDQAFVDLFYEPNPFNRPFLFNVFFFLELLIIPIYIGWIIILLRKYIVKIRNRYSSIEKIDLRWIKHLLIAIFGIWLTTNVSMLLSDQLKLIDEEVGLKYGFGLGVFCIFYLSYMGFKQTDTFSEIKFYDGPAEPEVERIAAPESHNSKYKKSGLKEEEAEQMYNELLKVMKEEQPFLNSQLSILDLANMLNVSTHNLSQVLNEKFGQSFYDFVNSYRVKEFKKRIQLPEHQHYTLLALALDCGFNSKASFNRIFKKFTDQTPSEYFKNIEPNQKQKVGA